MSVSYTESVSVAPTQCRETAFDPKPFIRTFEAAVDKLIEVRRDVQAKTEQLEKTVRVAEREYSKKMGDLNKGFEVCHSACTTILITRSAIPYSQSVNRLRLWRVRWTMSAAQP